MKYINEESLKIGTKIKLPKTKLGKSMYLHDSVVYNIAVRKKQNFLYYNGRSGKYYVLNTEVGGGGDYYSLEDLELFTSEAYKIY